MASEFKIGTSVEGLTSLDALTVALPTPKTPFRASTSLVATASGFVVGKGFPTCEWTFSMLEADQREQLRSFCAGASAEVYIRTMTNEGDAFGIYRAVMVWPLEEDRDPTARHDRLELRISFRRMIEVVV